MTTNALTLAVTVENVDEAAHDLAGKARYDLRIGAKRLRFTAPVSARSGTMSSHLHGEMTDLLASIPAGALLLVHGNGSPRCIDAQLAAVAAAGFTLQGVVWHYEHTIGGVRTKAVTERMARMVFVRQ